MVLALVVAPCACKREAQPKPQASAVPSAAPARYKPSSEPGILIPAVAGMAATLADKRVVLAQRSGSSGSGPTQGRGIYVTDDGLVFSYAYELPEDETQTVTPCDIRKLRVGSPERYQCLHHNADLRAKLEPALLGPLLLDLARVTLSERVEWPYSTHDGGGARLEVPGRGYKGSALELAACGTGSWQLSSPEADRIISVFRHVRRALGREWVFVADCPDFWEPRKEIAPGVRAWWSSEE